MTKLLLFFLLAAGGDLVKLDEAAYAKLINAQKGKVVLVDFWATWCVPCRKELPEIAKLEAKLKTKGFTVVTVSADEPDNTAQALAFLRKTGIGGQGYLKAPKNDDAFIRAIDPKWTGELPALFLYDKSGKVVKVWKGETAVSEIETAVSKLL